MTALLAIVGGAWLNQRSLERQLDQQNRVLEANLATVRAELAALRADFKADHGGQAAKLENLTTLVAQIQRQLEAIFKPILPK